ncbi:type II toxin-antitoxin system VapC family toxin [Metallosphaera tengchongensis]|uniref:Type II toxin-antitoxin system VapC family toxin n=1 Tax=Metallosphaera tengchongensis TaxID=1532350 RepID=A0A6N0NYX0_9CREN|nr:hypothetical protein [Metallosphaera tengchongensis]QKR00280.1 type II toxin-antitoxin system VapC family toxin [Metallosphaera tengchongensis]
MVASKILAELGDRGETTEIRELVGSTALLNNCEIVNGNVKYF